MAQRQRVCNEKACNIEERHPIHPAVRVWKGRLTTGVPYHRCIHKHVHISTGTTTRSAQLQAHLPGTLLLLQISVHLYRLEPLSVGLPLALF